MKKGLIALLSILLVISLGVNIYFVLNKFVFGKEKEEEKTFIKFNKTTISEAEFFDDIVKYGGDQYIQILKDKVLKDDLSKDELKAVEDVAEEQMDELKDAYGDELEDTIRQYTSYQSAKEYQNAIIISLAYEKRGEDKCKDEKVTSNCVDISRLEEMVKVLKDTKITFYNKELEKHWEQLIKSYEDSIKYYNEVGDEEDDYPTEEIQYDNLTELNLTGLKARINAKETFVIMITRTDCSYCMMYKPIMDEIAGENNIKIYYIETDHMTKSEYDELSEMVEFSGTPTTCLYVKGKLTDQMDGYRTKEASENFLKQYDIIK